MTKNEFKQGDRVRFTGDYDHYVEGALEKGKEYAVTYVDSVGDCCDLSVQCTAYSVDAEDLELVEPFDRRTAFLTELQALLRKYDAEIYACQTDFEEVKLYLIINKEEVEYGDSNDSEVTINADNIMDFDKE